MKKGGNTKSKESKPLNNVAEKSKAKTKNVKKQPIKALKDIPKEILKNPAPAQANIKEKKGKNKKVAKQPKQLVKKEEVEEKKEPEVLDPTEQAKIEKKKAKKLAKKLKKKEKKEQEKTQKEHSKSNGTAKKNTQKNGKEGEVVRDPLEEAATVFVGNLPTTIKRVQLVKLFKKYGEVKAIRFRTASGNVLFKHKQRKKAGSLNAYVSLTEIDAAKKALELNGFEFNGNHLRVTPSATSHSQNEHDAKRTVFVGNLKYTANAEKLHEIFTNCGEIDYIRCLTDGQEKCKGVAYVCFKAAEAVGLALELNETLLDERPIHVERYSVKKLGAKEARDKQEKSTQKKQFTGARKRIDDKKTSSAKKTNNNNSNADNDKKKKSEFRGVKVTSIKKKGKKKVSSEMKNLAKKIAPKIKKDKK